MPNPLPQRALDAALLLATKRGLLCFPVSTSKAPTCPRGFKDATAEPDALRDLWGRHPGPLIGVATGKASGIDVFDIDSTKHPEAAAWWAANRERVPPTRTHITPSGGMHLMFQHAPGLRSSAGRPDRGLGVLGLDVRANGGYAIWWPAAGFDVVTAGPLAPWPQWLLDGVRRLPVRAEPAAAPMPRTGDAGAFALGALRSAVKRVATAPDGCRNDTLNREAFSLGRFVKAGHLPEAWLRDVLVAAAIECGLLAQQASATIASALRAGCAQ